MTFQADLRPPVKETTLPVGLTAETAQIHEAVADVARGRHSTVLVEGERGSGKTALLDILAAECHKAGFALHQHTVFPQEQRLPLAALRGCLSNPVADAIDARYWAPLQSTDIRGLEEAADELARALLDAFARAGEPGPAAIILDDAHWADPASLLVLGRMQQLQSTSVLVAVATRMANPVLAVWPAVHAFTRLTTAPVDHSTVLGVARLASPRHLPGLRADRVESASGNPSHIMSAVQAKGASDFAAMAAQEVETLTDETRDIVDVATVLGRSVRISDLAAVLGVTEEELHTGLGEAVDQGILRQDRDGLVFRNEQLHRGLLASLPATVRTALRLQAGHALAFERNNEELAANCLLLAHA